jgi:putative DNA primase/helicase
MNADRLAIRRFIERVHVPKASGWLVLWTRQNRNTKAFNLLEPSALDEIVDYASVIGVSQDTYAAVGLQGRRPENGSRGKEHGVISLPGVWADVDVAGPAHKSANLPPSEEEALSFIDGVGLPPSVIVKSGYGFQPYWLLREPFVIGTEAERQSLKSLSRSFQEMLRLQARNRGWTLDSTADLCRVLRIPGTFNHKCTDDVRLVTAEYSDRNYYVGDLRELVSRLDEAKHSGSIESAPQLPLAKLPLILDGCAWIRHCRDDAKTLPEPEWYRMLTVIARCEDAEQWAHKLSSEYSKYSQRETCRKLKQASSNKVAPVTCAYVQSDLTGSHFCSECLFRGNVNSPIAIGRIETVPVSLDIGPASANRPAAAGEPEPSEAATTIAEELKSTKAAAIRIEKFTDLGNARRFVARYRHTILYCEGWSRWLVWDRMRWAEDERLEVLARAGDLIRSLYPLAGTIEDEDRRKAFLKHLIKSESHRSLSALLSLSRADRRFARHPDDFDSDPWLFTVTNGTINLKTGELLSHDAKHLITKLAPVTYDPSAQCPQWLTFLNMIMLERKSLIDFLKRALGSSLTGITSDKAMFILYGPGGDNGKSTLIEVMEMLLGNYARRTPIATFLMQRPGNIPNDIARLRGARFVWAAENDRDVRLAESVIKEMTGGDRMVARFMRGEFFEFVPAFKPWLATNHKPAVRGDATLWRRLKLVPFDYTIPKEHQKRRHEVMAMFQAELPGILNWAIEGCLEWQRNGLGEPEEVISATKEYQAEQDTFAMFLDEKCIRTPKAEVLSLPMYREYKIWAEEHGETAPSHKIFAALMSERGFKKKKTEKGVLYSGIGLRSEDRPDTASPANAESGDARFDHEEGEEV